jgi:hypothetical protein
MYEVGCPTTYIRSQTSAPLQGRAQRPSRSPQRSAPLLGFGPLRRISSRGVRSTRAFHTRHLPASGFLTLLPVCSSSGRVGLFHPTNAHGVSLFRAFPSRRGGRLVTDRVPSCRCRWAPKRPPVGSRGFLPVESPFTPAGGLDPKAAGTLLSFHPLQGSTRPAMGTASRPLPSCASGRSTFARRELGVPLSRGRGLPRRTSRGSPGRDVGQPPEGGRPGRSSGAGPGVGALPGTPCARHPPPKRRSADARIDLDTAPLGPTSHGWHMGPLPSLAAGGGSLGCAVADRSRRQRRTGTVPPGQGTFTGPPAEASSRVRSGPCLRRNGVRRATGPSAACPLRPEGRVGQLRGLARRTCGNRFRRPPAPRVTRSEDRRRRGVDRDNVHSHRCEGLTRDHLRRRSGLPAAEATGDPLSTLRRPALAALPEGSVASTGRRSRRKRPPLEGLPPERRGHVGSPALQGLPTQGGCLCTRRCVGDPLEVLGLRPPKRPDRPELGTT